MNPYTSTTTKMPTKKERRQMILNHPDAGPLAILWVKYPVGSKIVAILLLVAIVGFVSSLVF